MAKNTSPFLFETWSDEEWKNSWAVTKPYAVGSKQFLLMVKSQGFTKAGKNAQIYDLDEPCRLGVKLFSHRWTEGWTTAAFYKAGQDTFLFSLKRNGYATDGNNVHINRMKAYGDIGEQTDGARWTEGWTTARFYQAAGKQLLFIYKENGVAADGNNVHIIEMGDPGKLGNQIHTTLWTSGWTSVEFYEINGQRFLFLLKKSGTGADGNNVHIYQISGQTGLIVMNPIHERHLWSEGWTAARIFEARDRTYLFLLKAESGEVHIHHMKADGRVGLMMSAYDRKVGYTEAYGTGSEGPRGPIPWTTGWTNVEVINEGNHLFFAKQVLTGPQKRSAKICRVRPMESVGPLVGYVDRNQAHIWVGTVGGVPPATLTFRIENGPVQTANLTFIPKAEFPNEDDYYNAGVAHLQNLQENTRYLFEVILNGRMLGRGSFRTAPSRARGVFTMAVASCMDLRAPHYRVQKAWQHLLARQPDLLILGGDNCYPNTTMWSMIWAEHLQQRGVDDFADVIRQLPTFATWDDHDFGPNNSSGADKELAHRDETQRAFRQLFPGLPFAGNNGIYYRFEWRDVDIFMLDVRFFRDHYGDGGAMLGDEQWTWLENGLASSTARFKVLVSGTTLDSGYTETWADDYAAEFKRLKNLVRQYRGIVVVSGDIHLCQIQRHALSDTDVPILWEFTSSGIAQHMGNECYDPHGFMTLTFNTSAANNERIVARIYGKDGALVKQQTVLLSQTT